MSKWVGAVALAACLVTTAAAEGESLLDARKGFETTLTRQDRDDEPLMEPPARLFRLVRYETPAGEVGAYLGQPPGEGKHPAIIWLTGGFPPGGIGPSAWEPAPVENDQSAKAYRQAGLVMMYPTLRGSFGNPGAQEYFYGEVDDVLAALAYLQTVDYVDPEQIYLGGHSTGGTLALLVAEATSAFRAVVAFGPVDDPATYGMDLPFEGDREARLRAPIHYLGAITSPTYVIEGRERGNAESLLALQKASTNPKLRFLPVAGADHFDVLAPVNRLIAERFAAGDAELALTAEQLAAAVSDQRRAVREADDLETLAALRRAVIPFDAPVTVQHHVLHRDRGALEAVSSAAKRAGFAPQPLKRLTDEDGDPYFALVLRKQVTLGDLEAVFATSAALEPLVRAGDAFYQGWDVAD